MITYIQFKMQCFGRKTTSSLELLLKNTTYEKHEIEGKQTKFEKIWLDFSCNGDFV